MLMLKIKNVPKKLQGWRDSLAGQMSHPVWMDLGRTGLFGRTVLFGETVLLGRTGLTGRTCLTGQKGWTDRKDWPHRADGQAS